LVFSGIAALLVKHTAEKVTIRKPAKPMVFSKSPSMASIYSTAMEHEDLKRADTNQYEIKTAYYSAGSGIPEVKVILGGFVIKGFLGIKTLIVKSIGMVILILNKKNNL
jgi:chloride channel 3/4/5